MGLPQALLRGARWLSGLTLYPDGDNVTPERTLTSDEEIRIEVRALERLSDMLSSQIDRKVGVAHPHDWANYLKSYGEYGWLFACVSTIAETAAQVPIKLYRRKGDENRELPEHRLAQLLQYVNPEATWPQQLQLILIDLNLSGNSYTYMNRGKAVTRVPNELWRLNPARMKIIPGEGAGGIAKFKWELNTKEELFEPEEIIHIKFPNPDNDYYGLPRMSAAEDAANTDSYAIYSNMALLKRGANPRGIFEFDSESSLDIVQAREFVKEFDRQHAGAKAHGSAFVRGAKWKEIQWNPRDMEYIALRKMSREEICAVFKVPPAMVGIFEYANYANAAEQRSIFWENCLVPQLNHIAGSLNEFLTPLFGSDLFLAFDYSGIDALQRNIAEEAAMWIELVRARIALPDEARLALPEILGEAMPGGAGRIQWGNLTEVPLATIPEEGARSLALPEVKPRVINTAKIRSVIDGLNLPALKEGDGDSSSPKALPT